MRRPAKLSDLREAPADYHSIERPEMLPFVPAGARRIADVGCGTGSFGAALKRRSGAEVWGIELSAAAGREAEARLDRVLIGDASTCVASLPDAYFDCVVFNDVLEHLADPYQVLLRTQAKLAPEGTVVCSIPNVRYWRVLRGLLLRKDWRYEETGVLDRTHLRFFTERSIRSMFGELGYEILELRGINPTRKRGVRLVRALSLGWLSDIVYLEFGCRVRPYAAATARSPER
jgi:2-polyprenyl-3-methyl-5-hydroxy-6-metoxy-1,4-benzoquinol methylase